MCGIAGLLMSNQKVGSTALRSFLKQLAHRGPDSQNHYCDAQVGLAHTRLSVIDLTGGNQPLYTADREQVLVANGEIYNDPEIRANLEQEGITDFATHSDCESILYAYRRWGIDGLHRLNGMFAFALWDKQKQELLLARDRLGIKPLFYCRLPDQLIFASEIKALLPLLPNSPAIRPQALTDFLLNQFTTGRDTIFEGISRVLPGETLKVDSQLNIEHHRYWNANSVTPRAYTMDEAFEDFNPLFNQVFKEHIRSDVPYGLFLSGGVDSAVLLAMLHRFQEHPIQTFSVGFRDSQMSDELESASILAKQFRTNHTRLELGRDELLERLVHTTWACDDLMRDYASLPLAVLSERASETLKVVFTGEGGDEVFAGYRRYRISAEDRIKALLNPGTGGFRTHGQWRGSYQRKVLSPKLEACIKTTRHPFQSAFRAARKDWTACAKRQFTDLSTGLPDNLLVKADRITMSFGLEARVPMLDHRVVEFGLSLPDKLKINGRQGKWFLKQWALNFLPEQHILKPKKGFHVPVGEWLTGDFLKKLGPKLLNDKAIREWFKPQGVSLLLKEQADKGSATREIYGLMQFAIWHQLFIERPGTIPSHRENPLDWIGVDR